MATPTRAVAPVILPELNMLVRLTLGVWADPKGPIRAADVPSRVEDVVPAQPGNKGSPAQLLIARPHYDGDVEEPVDRAFCLIQWTTPTGLWEVPGAYLGKGTVAAGVPVWQVEVVGTAQRQQRRNHVRVEWSSPVTIEVVDYPSEETELPRVLEGRAINLSEGGIRVMVPPPVLPPDTKVLIHLAIDQGLKVPAFVIRAIGVSQPETKPYQLVIAFENPDAYGDEIRREVFETQMKLRKLGKQ